MSDMNNAFKNMEANMEPLAQFNEWMSESMESACRMMMESARGYTNLGITSLENALEIRQPEDVLHFAESQFVLMHQVGDQMMSDARSYSDMALAMFSKAMTLYETGAKNSTEVSREAVKQYEASTRAGRRVAAASANDAGKSDTATSTSPGSSRPAAKKTDSASGSSSKSSGSNSTSSS